MCLTSSVYANTQPKIIELDKVMVKGVIPGPDLWKVSKGNHVMWILGTISPLPSRMDWDSHHINDVIGKSQSLLLPPTLKLDADMGFFQKLMLAKTAIGIKNNPEKQKLQDIVPSDMYQRWLGLKEKYMGNNRQVEKYRPIVAAHRLFEKALKKSGLNDNPKVVNTVKKMAKKHRVNINQPTWSISPKEPKAAIKQLKDTPLNDLPCFDKKLERLEQDLEHMKTRAVAWSYGDIETIESLPFPQDNETCGLALLNSEFAEQIGLVNVPETLKDLWLSEAQKSLATHSTTFAVLPIFNLLGDDSYLSLLAKQGYQIKAPAKFKK
ncbi:MAG: TraB/GumN family protein [Marinicella sp.]